MASPNEDRGRTDLHDNFFRMTIIFAIGHGFAITPLVFASSILEAQAAYFGNSALYIVGPISALFVATPVVGMIGLIGGMTLALGLYGVYVIGFTLAAVSTTPFLQGALFMVGSICGGLGAGILWTAQGGFLAHSASAISGEGAEGRELIVSQLATTFAFYYLLFEMIAKVVWSSLIMAGMSVQLTGLLYASLATASAFAMTWVSDVKPQTPQQEMESMSTKLLGAVRLWPDIRLWLLSPTNITFGVSAAYINGVFNSSIAAATLGTQSIGWLTAFTLLVSIATTKLFGLCGPRFGNIVPITIGAASFACIPLIFIVTHCCQDWGWSICVFYALQGVGRSVYENTNKAVFADTFKGEHAEGAFANCMMQASLAASICFFMSAIVDAHQLQMTVLIFAMITPIAYIAKTYVDSSTSPEANALIQRGV